MSAKRPAQAAEILPAGHAENAPAGNTGTPSICGSPTPAAATNSQSPPAVPDRTANAARPAELESSEPAPPPVSHDVALHLADGEKGLDIRMAERGGEIRVTVHTPDHELADSLRADLPDLVGKLRQNGFVAETWGPAAAAQSDAGRRSGSDASPFQDQAAGNGKNGRQQRPPQQNQPKDQSRWAGEWKSSLDPAPESNI